MTKDLTKLTAEQLCRQWQNEIAFSDPEQPVFILDEWGEIERRVRHEEELEQALAEAQQAREREHAEVLRLESEIAEVCQEDYSLKECWDAVTREMDSHINARMKLQEQRDTLRGLLREARDWMVAPGAAGHWSDEESHKQYDDICERITAALKEG